MREYFRHGRNTINQKQSAAIRNVLGARSDTENALVRATNTICEGKQVEIFTRGLQKPSIKAL